jgi:hypothetical protein
MAFTQKQISYQLEFGGGFISGLRSTAIITMPGGAANNLDAVIYGMPLSDMNKYTTFGTPLDLIGKNTVTVTAGDKNGMTVAYKGTRPLRHRFRALVTSRRSWAN